MFSILSFIAYAPAGDVAAPSADAGASAGGFSGIILVLMVAFFYFLIIMPQRKRDKQFKQMMEKLKVGDKVVTAGGIIGKITMIKPDSLRLRTGTGTELDVTRKAIAVVVNKGENEKEELEPDVNVKQ
ncbi:MAG TPA: preprotein translocase subunit YajC [Mesotoga infera]|uniref:Preprotein translocase subunit YajC n=1 Tax=Mesotoga infera TaxID=1236046 RepID=A0A101H0J2_9BACT|nr:MAG: Preprotein translocase, YajC subunit [Mesotoga infera]KUK89905.1 MAG: Preprotein translocase, YajC subunit [Mesotoga infera]HCO69478.1 preprotein translocase subunit YajC [Mesotoga infera]